MRAPESDFHAIPVAHLPVIRALIDDLGIHAIIEDFLPMHALSRVSDADCVVTMMLNILCGRVALFRMDAWLGRTDVELLLGSGHQADAFADSRLAAALDHLDVVGTDNVLSRVVERYFQRPERETTYSVHQDFTTVTLFGEYADVSPNSPLPAFGHSKDDKPDLKQLVFGLSIHGSAGIPLVCTTLDGNTSDSRANRDHLARLAKLLPDEDEVTVVADCKLVDGTTLGQLLSAGFHFVTLFPDNYKLRSQLVVDAFDEEPDPAKWPILGSHPGRRKADPVTNYRGRSFERDFPMLLHKAPSTEHPGPNDAVESIETMRFVVIHSDALLAAFDGRLESRLNAEMDEITAAITRTNRKPASCEHDALASAQKALPKLHFHQIELSARPEERPAKRKGKGRRPKGEAPKTETVWIVAANVTLDAEAVSAERRHASCFPLMTSHLDTPGWDAARILAEYRHQGVIEGNTGFRWLKGPAAVAPMFLKTPTRMRALGLVMVLALMVRNYWQYRMRGAAKAEGKTIDHPFTRRAVNNLTAEMAMEHFGGILAYQIRRDDGNWVRTKVTIPEVAREVLAFLAVPETVFWTPPIRKLHPIRV